MRCKNCKSTEIGVMDAEIRIVTNPYSGAKSEKQSLHCVCLNCGHQFEVQRK